ncbi:MAG: hypothetical protein WAM30_16995 [Candidatus Dormiibacterota bacterium]
MRRLALLPAAVFLIAGAVWVLQGVGLIKGSFMTGDRRWEAIGLVVFILGLLLGWFGLRRKRVTQA